MHGTADIWINEHKIVNSQIPHNILSLHKWSIPPNLELGQCRVFLPRRHMHEPLRNLVPPSLQVSRSIYLG